MHKPIFQMRFLSFAVLICAIVLGSEPLLAQAPPPAGAAKPGGLNLPTQQEWIEGFGRMGMEALGATRDLRGGWQRGPYWQRGRGWRYVPADRGRQPLGRDRWSSDWMDGYYYPDDQQYEPNSQSGQTQSDQTQSSPTASNKLPSNPPPKLVPNPLPDQARLPGRIRPIGKSFDKFKGGAIVNPVENKVTLSYRLGGRMYKLPPGSYQDLGPKRIWTIEFDRGGSFGPEKYQVGGNKHVFTPSDRGWELYREQ